MPRQLNQNYKKIVNIYSVNGYKTNKRKNSHLPDSGNNRIHLNHSMLPHGGLSPQGNSLGYDERRAPSNDGLSLPELPNKNSNQYHSNHNLGRAYPYKSSMEQQNSAMIQKLMTRKKSYERMMKLEDVSGGRQHSDLQSKKSQDILMSASRPQLARIQGHSSSVKKQLNYLDSTPQNHRKGNNSVLRGSRPVVNLNP